MTDRRKILEAVHREDSRVMGELAVVLATGRGLSGAALRRWVAALRAAADALERLLEE